MNTGGLIARAIGKVSRAILTLAEKTDKIKGRKPEGIVVSLYCILHMLMLIVHEPWFDEALAWLIARDSSVYEILFVAPHYEGHPSLWHLILLPFAKSGAPYEFSLSIVSLAFSGIAIAIIVFKSPFKRLIRLLIPFTYFIFYQYSVISRPYCMMMLAFAFMGLTYSKRDEHPGRFVLSAMFLCMTSAYGIVIAGGICLTWLYEIWKKSDKKITKSIKLLYGNGKLFWLLFLLCYAIFLVLRLVPAEDAFAVIRNSGENVKNGLIIRILYVFFASFSDLFLTNVYYSTGTLHGTDISFVELLVATAIGITILSIIIKYAVAKKKLVDFLIPYFLFCSFGTMVYLFDHHIGILLLFFGYWLWTAMSTCTEESKEDREDHNGISYVIVKNPIVRNFLILMSAVMLVITLYWGIGSSVCDIFYEYGFGRNEYDYLKEHDLDKSTMLSRWIEGIKVDDNSGYSETVLALSSEGVSISPYISDEIMLNAPRNLGFSYVYTHKIWTDEEVELQIKTITERELPEVLIGHVDVDSLYNNETCSIANYTKVYQRTFSCIKKAIPGKDISYILVRNDCEPLE